MDWQWPGHRVGALLEHVLPVRLLQLAVVLVVDVSGLGLPVLHLRRQQSIQLALLRVNRRRNAAQYRDNSPGGAELLGKFDATQRTARYLVSNKHTHHVVVFRSTVMFVGAAPMRDRVAAWLHTAAVLLPLVGQLANLAGSSQVSREILNWLETADSGLARAAGAVPSSVATNEKLASLQHLTPDLLEECFPGIVYEIPTLCITSAFLNHGPVAVAKRTVPGALVDQVVAAAAVPLSVAISQVPVVPALVDPGPLAAELIIKYRDPERIVELEAWFGATAGQPLDAIASVMRELLGDRFSQRAETWSALRRAVPILTTKIDRRPTG
jgi:hypothetical protein